MEKYGLIGWPVTHSVSPALQNAGFQAAGIAAEYNLLPVQPQDLTPFIAQLKNSYAGWNCTIPHKQHILEYLDDIDQTAKILGSVNTVVNHKGHLKGYSTDGYGMEMSLKESFNLEINGGKFLFIGAGGAARAVALYFALKGARKIGILNRTLDKAQAIQREIACIDKSITVEIDSLESPKIDLSTYQVVIQSTSVGLKPDDPSPISVANFNSAQVLVDMVYKQTAFLKDAAVLGLRNCDGKGMLLHQGIKSWEIWTGQKAPIEAMRQALYKALG